MEINAQPLVSVIIPVYNAAHTLRRCVDSLFQQDYANIEIILVNDGSKDGSLEVCRVIESIDPRVKVFTQENGGCSAARNTALSHATGDYYCFMDADDTMVRGALKKMLTAIHNNDLLIAHFNFVMGKTSSKRGLFDQNTTLNDRNFMRLMVKQPGTFYYSALWNKLYRGDIIRDNELTFDGRLTWGEDFAFNMSYYRYVSSVRYLPTAVYNYNKASSGICVRALANVGYSCRIKWYMYGYFKALCVEKGLWDKQKGRIRMYIFNVTLND